MYNNQTPNITTQTSCLHSKYKYFLGGRTKKFTNPIIQKGELGKISNTVSIYDRGL
jgi:hypothetical protein